MRSGLTFRIYYKQMTYYKKIPKDDVNVYNLQKPECMNIDMYCLIKLLNTKHN